MNVHVYPSTIENESRILKITTSLAKSGIFDKIEILGRWREGLPERASINSNVEIVRIKPLRLKLMGRTIERVIAVLSWYIRTIIYLSKHKIECINPHSLPVLPLTVLIKALKGCKLVYDTHELETETISCKGLKRLLYKATEKMFIRYCDAICVVNKSIASWYSETYNIPAPFVVKNVPHRSQIQGDRSNILKDTFNIPHTDIVFLYQGLLSEGRGIRITLEAFKGKAGKHAIFMGYGELSCLIEDYEKKYPNIHYKTAVAPELIPQITPSADIGLSLIENKCLSYYLCLPNKVYEYLNSGVPVVASAFPEMSSFINENEAGWSIDPSVESLSYLIDSTTKDIVDEKRNKILKKNYSFGWHAEEDSLFSIYKEIGYL
ncbi:glycosyltransferase [Bdellovibrio bacteriovorus]|uniref:Beta-1,4-mannosyltransferase n=1 Tax=Bdellovibrio bacteriovorus str. Tiberius TaxID=1069642 RepID=K7ZFB9_BDEBC|nr:glycosyltransferase [Bdellovibrio bacteriovorus]AFY01372.1 Glycosyltransferase [Bdellovibrio bacteriovorus str. Tiberius]